MRIRSSFARFQEQFVLIVQGRDEDSPATTAHMYVGKYFTEKGEFDQVVRNNQSSNIIIIVDLTLYFTIWGKGGLYARCQETH
jgi:hypothetical protein